MDGTQVKESKWNKFEKKLDNGGDIKAKFFIKKGGEFPFNDAKGLLKLIAILLVKLKYFSRKDLSSTLAYSFATRN